MAQGSNWSQGFQLLPDPEQGTERAVNLLLQAEPGILWIFCLKRWKPRETGGAGVSEGNQSCTRRTHEVSEEQRTPRTESTKKQQQGTHHNLMTFRLAQGAQEEYSSLVQAGV